MPNMVGCSLQTACDASASSSAYCQPFTLLATICDEMPAMRDCSTYTSLCRSGSLVPQCKNYPPIPYAPTTREATDAVLSMCSSHGMVGCETCTTAAKCPNPFDTLSQLCLGMPSMADCKQFFSMCSVVSSDGDSLNGLCAADMNSDNYLPPMRMWLHTGITDIVLIKEWVPTDGGYYFGTLVACFAAAVLCQYLKAAKIEQEIIWASRRPILPCRNMACGSNVESLDIDDMDKAAKTPPACCGGGAGGPSELPGSSADNAVSSPSSSSGSRGAQSEDVQTRKPNLLSTTFHVLFSWCAFSKPQFKRNAIRSMFTGIIVFLDYLLMLIVMTFNIGIILAVVFGFMVGTLLFGHTGEKAGSIHTGGASGNVDPTDELDVRFMEAPSCCGTTGFI